jgi:hypothetical protein
MVLGRADFDGDGKQDWLLRADLAYGAGHVPWEFTGCSCSHAGIRRTRGS